MLGMDKEQKLQEKVPAFAFYVKTGQQFFDAVKKQPSCFHFCREFCRCKLQHMVEKLWRTEESMV